ncbi:MAG TPA: hypothetical protein VFT22_27990 [Kofleriaceae bacterium]|nr:hypothetical protein [Kofleriaceae bacterium]
MPEPSEPRGRITIERQDDALALRGAIDETAGLSELIDRASGGRPVLDPGGITFINHLGVRDRIRMQAAAQRAGVALERGAARVTSFFASYACDACGREDSLWIDGVADARGLARLHAPAMSCVECGTWIELDDFPARYFSFLSV